MPFAAAWVDLEFVIVNEGSQKDKYHVIAHICGI